MKVNTWCVTHRKPDAFSGVHEERSGPKPAHVVVVAEEVRALASALDH